MNTQKPELCPMSGHRMISKERKDGQGTFWACSGFPDCRYIWKDPSEIKPAYRKVTYKYPLIPPNASQNANVATTEGILDALRKAYVKIEAMDKKIDKVINYLDEKELRDINVTPEELKEIF